MSYADHNYGTPPPSVDLNKQDPYGAVPQHELTRALPQQYTPPQQAWVQQPTYTQPQYHQPYPAPSVATSITRPGPSGALLAVAWIIALFTFFYMLPWAIAATRNKSNHGAIAVLNFFLGWSFIGWIVALVMACSAESNNNVVVVNQFHGVPQQYR